MLLFDLGMLHDAAVDDGPIIHDGGRLTIEKAEEFANRFLAKPKWQFVASFSDFPRSTGMSETTLLPSSSLASLWRLITPVSSTITRPFGW